jgi:hypothetical protein
MAHEMKNGSPGKNTGTVERWNREFSKDIIHLHFIVKKNFSIYPGVRYPIPKIPLPRSGTPCRSDFVEVGHFSITNRSKAFS